MRILFTGATGVLGNAAIPALVATGHQVDAVARRDADRRRLAAVGASPVAVDLFDPTQIAVAVAGTDVVFHYATAIPPRKDYPRREAWSMNDRLRSEATRLLVDAALVAGVDRLVQQSITFVYADGGDMWLDEDAPIGPVRENLRSALDAEAEVDRFRLGGGTGVTLRHALVYGPRASDEYVAALRAGEIVIQGNGANFVSSVHVDDLATSLVAALEAPDGVYNVSDDRPVTAWEYNASLAGLLEVAAPRRMPAGRPVVSHRVSNRRFRETTGWAPRRPSVVDGWPTVVSD